MSVSGRGATTAGQTDSEQDSIDSNNLPQRDFKLRKISSIRIGFWSIRITYLNVISKHGTGINKTFCVTIDGTNFLIDSDDIRATFGLGEPVVLDVPPLEWPLVILEFPPKEVMEEELIVSGRKKGIYLRCKNVVPTLCLLHMVAHRNIIPQLGNKNVLVGNMIYLVYLYAKGLRVDLVLIILHEMSATANPDNQTRPLPYSRFIAQILTDLGYVIRPDEEIDEKNKVINSRYWEKSRKHMLPVLESETEGDAADSRTEFIPARRAARFSTSTTAPTNLPDPSAYAPTELVPPDLAALHSYIETRFTRMETQIQSQFQIFTDVLGRLQNSMDALSSGPPAPDRDEQS
ncbi:hypothetical protein GIB67_040969 [Kingdonia uniflora]|uniref:Uncharacterized protein n=1 Tax=Kingdonia uniflora TaxID=39325 RepID=A0A7J7NC41_9MAGN|nr:hypothetical protein GIB67_040969 [Kingdonia uniflora]